MITRQWQDATNGNWVYDCASPCYLTKFENFHAMIEAIPNIHNYDLVAVDLASNN